MVRRRLVRSRGEAQAAIDTGLVRVRDNPAPKASTLVAPNDPVFIDDPPARFVSRGGNKLDGALDTFDVEVRGRAAIDIGASTGGFTDCLLQRGAASVTALDVGYGQLHQRIRDDQRVTVVERTNIRYAEPTELGAPFDVIVADLSFISLSLVAPSLAELGAPPSDWVLLVKPQFEVGRTLVGKGGIVRDPDTHVLAIEKAASALESHGVGVVALARSALAGAGGNIEFLIHGRRADRSLDTGTVRAIVLEEGRA